MKIEIQCQPEHETNDHASRWDGEQYLRLRGLVSTVFHVIYECQHQMEIDQQVGQRRLMNYLQTIEDEINPQPSHIKG